MKRFKDFGKNNTLEGDKIKIEKVLNTEIIILGYDINPSKHNDGKYLTLQLEINNEKRVLFTGSEVLIDQLETYKDEIPFLTVIKKINNKYYSLT